MLSLCDGHVVLEPGGETMTDQAAVIAAVLSERIAIFSSEYIRRTSEAPDAAAIMREALHICTREMSRLDKIMTEPAERCAAFVELADHVAEHLKSEPEFMASNPWQDWRNCALKMALCPLDLPTMYRWIESLDPAAS
jgi:hypothetical protein